MSRFIQEFRNYHPHVIVILAATLLLTIADAISLLFLPLYLANNFEMSPLWIGIVTGLLPLVATLGGFLSGTLSDIFGRKPVLVISLFAYGLSLIGFTASTHIYMIFPFILVKGFFYGFFPPVSKALLGDVTPPEKRLNVFSLRYLTINIAYAVGPLLGLILGFRGAKMAFILAAGVYLVVGCLLYFILHRDYHKTNPSPLQEEKPSIASSWRAVRTDLPLLLIIFGGILSSAVHGQWSIPLLLHLNQEMSDPAKLFAMIVCTNSVCVLLFQYPLTRIAQRYLPINAITIGSCLMAVGMVGFGISFSWWQFVLSMVIFTLGEVLVTPAEYLMLDQITPNGLRGTYYGAQSFTTLGSVIGPWVGSALLTHSTGVLLAFGTYSIMALLSILFFSYVSKTTRPVETTW